MNDPIDELVDAAGMLRTSSAEGVTNNSTRCSACLTVIPEPAPGETRSCRCGLLTVTGSEHGPLRAIKVKPGAGWSSPLKPK